MVSATGCNKSKGAWLVVVVTATGSPSNVAALDVTVNGPAGAATVRYPQTDRSGILFPTTLGAALPARAVGELTVEVEARDPSGATIATGRSDPFAVGANERRTVYVALTCSDGTCASVDGGPDQPDGGPPPFGPRCGNGRVDPGETCDTAIAPPDPGACPPASCDDHIVCTRDTRVGDACTAQCMHEEITTVIPGDGCCPAFATATTDPDCSASCGNGTVDPGETCDIGIPAPAPGACPTRDDCLTQAPCSQDQLISEGTCSAVCSHVLITVQSGSTVDNCCPPGAYHGVDYDCPIAVCGNGIVEAGEACDVGIAAPGVGACPSGCDDNMAATTDVLTGAACQSACLHLPITAFISGDGYCPPGATHASDSDCPTVPSANSSPCGNGVLDPGETCDRGASDARACPTACPSAPSACLTTALVGSASDCSAHCVTTAVTACSRTADGCCPAGCTSATDADCSPACGDGVVQTGSGETCDIAIAAGRPGACPTDCASPDPCREARLIGAGTCSATCVQVTVTAIRAGDGCCPPGADFTVDPDCAPVCGNGIVEQPVESCDYVAGNGSCPATCPAAGSCTRAELRGSATTCTAICVSTPIDACGPQDGCCPEGCTAAADPDCPPVCGDGVVDGSETCDRGITAGLTGACPRSCDDGDACTVDLPAGSVEDCNRSCIYARITACLDGDGCCPLGCNSDTDHDCGAVCKDGRVGAGETCDPPSSCPTVCPDDGDPCTREVLIGDPARCTAACRHVPITSCSGTTSDLCCPTGCTASSDTDC